MSSHIKNDESHAQQDTLSEPPPTTTNGARSGANDLTEVLNSECIAWIVTLAEEGKCLLSRLDSLVKFAGSNQFDPTFRQALTLLSCSGKTQDAIHRYVTAKFTQDYTSLAVCTRILVNDPDSPFYARPRLGLPPRTSVPESEEKRKASPVVHDVFRESTQLIAKYQIRTFDPAIDPESYLEWKYAILDVCKVAANDEIRLEVIMSSIAISLRLTLLDQDLELTHANVLESLDKAYKTLRAIRRVEYGYLNLKQLPDETISQYYSRFQNRSRLYEKSKNVTLSDPERIVAFGAGIDNRYRFLLNLIETFNVSNFTEYCQHLIHLSTNQEREQKNSMVDFAFMDYRKRARTEVQRNDKTTKGFGCYRCGQGAHVAVDCPNEVSDYDQRCSTCGSRKHKMKECKARVTRLCRRCNKGKHFESICPSKLAESKAVEAISGYDELKEALTLSVLECNVDCSAMEGGIDVDADPPSLDIEFMNRSIPALADTGASASFMDTATTILLARGTLSNQMRFSSSRNPSLFDSEMGLPSLRTWASEPP